ncbi:hypothetical protein M446_6451 [Methylobacterium sp. 4-46]|uniref:hypothetical protein n=1 Tax=unclassified Methylobacterium TaxID=2615210 RepID=UPI000152D726|nr:MULTISPECIES: hypothetical protein [Methylobacterium]ACA20710.1 hypothetical protein M446_6451 [Methylobacterium sp. 4-46]WFT79867.1 hypothetical protein QA634_32570 [Methylobacterium nodulans]
MTSRNPAARAVTFDAYGEPLESGREPAPPAGDRRARTAAAALFWTLALALVAARICVAPAPEARTAASARAHLADLVSAP